MRLGCAAVIHKGRRGRASPRRKSSCVQSPTCHVPCRVQRSEECCRVKIINALPTFPPQCSALMPQGHHFTTLIAQRLRDLDGLRSLREKRSPQSGRNDALHKPQITASGKSAAANVCFPTPRHGCFRYLPAAFYHSPVVIEVLTASA